MLYAVLCYNDEDAVWSWSSEEDAAVMARVGEVHARYRAQGKFGAGVRLMPTTTATCLRKACDPPLVVDGPYAETEAQMLGFYLIDVEGLTEALDFCRDLTAANPGGAYEVRPVAVFAAGARLA